VDSVPTNDERVPETAAATPKTVEDVFDLGDPDVQQLASALIRLLRSMPEAAS
jgi:hypothetical protein